jgi:predicted signal transduction protein with EAL and GGDEF domain
MVYVALFLAVQGGVLVAFTSSIPPGVRGQIEDQLNASARVFKRIMSEREAQLGVSAQLLARDYGFRDAIATADEPTIRSALRNQQQRIGADLAVVLDLDGTIVTTLTGNARNTNNGGAGGADTGAPELPSSFMAEAEEKGAASRILPVQDRLYQLVLVPVMAPEPIAWIVFGTELDQAAARDIKALSPIDLDLAFLRRGDDGALHLAAATSSHAALEAFLAQPAESATGSLLQGAHEVNQHLFWGLPLLEQDGRTQVAAVLYYSLDSAMQAYTRLVAILLLVTAGGLLVLIVGSVLVSRGVTRPLRDLARASQRVAAGDYREVVAPARDVEFNDLTGSFNRMVGAVKEREQHIRFQASHDIETGLPNRLDFERRLGEQLAAGTPTAVALVEIQNLAELRVVLTHADVNDLMGAIGDRLGCLASSAPARLSTESFALLLDGDEGTAPDADRRLEALATTIRNSFLAPFTVGDIVVDTSARLGLVRHPRDGEDIATLLRHACAALDSARLHPQGLAWYDRDSDDSRNRRLSLMSELREGLSNGEVTFAYQPKLDLATGTVKAVEALVRWKSATRGFVPPDEFIPLAERTGDVRLLTEWGLRTAVRQLAAWQERGCEVAIAVNLSTSDLMNQRLPQLVAGLLHEHRVPASRLKLEVTESAVMQDAARALAVLNELAAMGLSLSIDDYGTGYSSLGYIKRLPVSEIKIDKSFVTHLATSEEDNILVRSTIDLGHNLGLSVTAEGVEDEESLRRLRAYGCDCVQGYLISRPVPVADLEPFLGSAHHVEA